MSRDSGTFWRVAKRTLFGAKNQKFFENQFPLLLSLDVNCSINQKIGFRHQEKKISVKVMWSSGQTPWPTFPGCVLHVQVPLAKNSSVLNFALQKKLKFGPSFVNAVLHYIVQTLQSTFNTVAMIIPFYDMEENDTFTNTSSYLKH